jgi:predicted membrane metal-binding protein
MQVNLMHENFRRQEKIKGSSDRSFGLVIAAVFALAAFLPLLRSPHQPRWWAAIIAIAFALVALLWPKRLAVLNRLWLKFGLLLHAVVSPVVLGLIFYVAIVPVGLLKRVFGSDSLRLKADRTARTYWITRQASDSALSSMKQQF